MNEITTAINPTKADASADEFRTMAQKILPHLHTIQQVLAQYFGDDECASIHLGADGYIDFTPYKTGWRLSQCSGGKPSIRYEYSESLSMEESKS